MLYIKCSEKYNSRVILIICSLIIFLWSLSNIFATDNLAEYERELEKVKQEQKENSEKLTGIDKELAFYAYEIANYDSQMLEYSKKSGELQEEIEAISNKLDELDESLENSDAEYTKAVELYANRLRILYENGLPSILDIYIKSETLSDFFLKMEIYNQILEYDKNTIGRFQNKKDYVDYIKKDIQVQKLQLENLKDENDAQIEALNLTIETKQNKMKELESTQSELIASSESLIQKRKEALSKIDDEVARVIREAQEDIANGTSTTFTGGDFVWPVSGYVTITTRFGQIYNLVDPAGSAHTGTDIAGASIMGKPILAIESGKVTTATYSNYGYGNYVIINHGRCTSDNNNYISLYGHCSSLTVEPGDMVEKGQVIGYVGSTGNSTGPHLHLEIRINGILTDPLAQYPAIEFNHLYL
ncbi:MAG: peptidoglycan DD-metalloendopeptidase family protein [Clostridia bacterium]|nr:peptidoglycan DD-metalloendopeptidase family protein [Clostridia bacterium]